MVTFKSDPTIAKALGLEAAPLRPLMPRGLVSMDASACWWSTAEWSDTFTVYTHSLLLSGRTLSFIVNVTDTVRDLMVKIEAREGIPVQEQIVIFAGKRLLETDICCDVLSPDAHFHLTLRLKGGGKRARSGFVAEGLEETAEESVVDLSVRPDDVPLVIRILQVTSIDVEEMVLNIPLQQLQQYNARLIATKNNSRVPDMTRVLYKDLHDLEVATETLTERVQVCREWVKRLIEKNLKEQGHMDNRGLAGYRQWVQGLVTTEQVKAKRQGKGGATAGDIAMTD